MTFDYKLLIADVDSTLRLYGSAPGELTLNAFRKLHEAGVVLGIASGRPLWQEMMTHASDWGLDFQFDFIIGMNGGEIYDSHRNTRNEYNALAPETIREIITEMEPTGIKPSVYFEGITLALEMNDLLRMSAARHNQKVIITEDITDFWKEPNIKIMFRCPSPEIAARVEEFGRQFDCDRYHCFRTAPIMVEFEDPRNSKGSALRTYCSENGIKPEDIIAFGDAINDLDMLEYAGRSVAVANRLEEVRQFCDHVTARSAREDGVGDYLFSTYDL